MAPEMRATVNDNLNVRTGPDKDSELIATLPMGSEVAITGMPESGTGLEWWPIEVEAGGETISGWVWVDGLDMTGAMRAIAIPNNLADGYRRVSNDLMDGWDTVTGWLP